MLELTAKTEAGARLEDALRARVAAGAPGALALLDAPRHGLHWAGSAGRMARGGAPPLRPEHPFRAASVTKHVTAAVALRLAQEGRLALDEPLRDLLAPELLERWARLEGLPYATPRQLLSHTSGLHDYFHDPAFSARVETNPRRRWTPLELVDHAAAHGAPHFPAGRGFHYSDTGYVVTGILLEQLSGRPLHELYRRLAFDPLGMDDTWLEGHEPPRVSEVAHHYNGERDLTSFTPTIDWSGGGLVTTARDLRRFVRGLWGGELLEPRWLAQLTRWTPGVSFPAGHAVSYDAYGVGTGRTAAEGVELVGHTGYIGAFAFYAPRYDAVLVGTHNDASVDRLPLVAALCRELRAAAG